VTGAEHVPVVQLVREPARRCGALQNVRTSYPLELITMDIVGPLPPSKSGNKYILVVFDYFTRWVEAFGISSQNSVTVANCIVDSVFCRWRLPSQLHSDTRAQFESQRLVRFYALIRHNVMG